MIDSPNSVYGSIFEGLYRRIMNLNSEKKKMKTAGIEPATDGFGIRHSTAELSLRTINRRNHVHLIIILKISNIIKLINQYHE